MNNNLINEYFDIALVVPLEEELSQVFSIFPSKEDRSTATTLCHVLNSGAPNIRMILIHQEGMGKTHAMTVSQDLLNKYKVGLMVCLGIAGGLKQM